MAPLDEIRRAAHQRLMQQARERVMSTVVGGGHGAGRAAREQYVNAHYPGGYGTNAESLHQMGVQNADTARIWELNHPAAIRAGKVPNWVMQQEEKAVAPILQTRASVAPSSNPILKALNGASPSPMSGIVRAAEPGGQLLNPSLGGGHIPLIHLGQGLFLHPETGEIHGFGPGGLHIGRLPAPAPAGPPAGPFVPRGGPVAMS